MRAEAERHSVVRRVGEEVEDGLSDSASEMILATSVSGPSSRYRQQEFKTDEGIGLTVSLSVA